MKHLSIRVKLVIMLLAVSLPVIIAGSLIDIFRSYNRYRTELIARTESVASLVAGFATYDLAYQDREQAKATLEHLAHLPAVQYACLFDKSGERFAQFRHLPSTLASAPAARPGSWFAGEYLFTYQPVLRNESDQIGTLFVLTSTASLNQELNNTIITSLVTLLAILLLALLASAVLQRFISRPILQLADLADQITESGEFERRIPNDHTDEIGRLYRSFNVLLAKISSTSVSKERVEEAEAELKIQNARLKRQNELLQAELEKAKHLQA